MSRRVPGGTVNEVPKRFRQERGTPGERPVDDPPSRCSGRYHAQRDLKTVSRLSTREMRTMIVSPFSERRHADSGRTRCTHEPHCPPASAPDHAAARTVASHPEQGWSLLCNGVVVFDDTGEILPSGRCIAAHRPENLRPAAQRWRSEIGSRS